MIDGSCFSMPDSDRNRVRVDRRVAAAVGKLVTLFCLHTGRLIAFAHNTWKTHELRLARELVRHLRAGEVVLAEVLRL
jgi:hypothetical protein